MKAGASREWSPLGLCFVGALWVRPYALSRGRLRPPKVDKQAFNTSRRKGATHVATT